MGIVLVCGIGFLSCIVYLLVFVHKPVPGDCPDRLYIMMAGDFFSFFERIAEVREIFERRYWLRTKSKNDITHKNGCQLEWRTFANVNSVVITPGKSKDERGTVVFYHGGGWVMGSIGTYLNVLIDIANETGCIVMSPDYRLAPKYPFPIPYEDCLNSTLDYLSNSHQYGIDLNKVVIMGDSSGGNLAAAVTAEIQQLHKRKMINYKAAMQVLVYPYLQMVDYQLPSYTTNMKYLASPTILQKVWLAYAGLNDRMDLAGKLMKNGHVDNCNERIKQMKQQFISPQFIEEKYKLNWKKSDIKSTTGKDLLDGEIKDKLRDLMLDVRMAPLMMSDEQLSILPRTHIFVCHYDSLRDDGLLYMRRLDRVKVETSLQYLTSSMHGVLNIGSLLKKGYHYEENNKMCRIIAHYLSTITT